MCAAGHPRRARAPRRISHGALPAAHAHARGRHAPRATLLLHHGHGRLQSDNGARRTPRWARERRACAREGSAERGRTRLVAARGHVSHRAKAVASRASRRRREPRSSRGGRRTMCCRARVLPLKQPRNPRLCGGSCLLHHRRLGFACLSLAWRQWATQRLIEGSSSGQRYERPKPPRNTSGGKLHLSKQVLSKGR